MKFFPTFFLRLLNFTLQNYTPSPIPTKTPQHYTLLQKKNLDMEPNVAAFSDFFRYFAPYQPITPPAPNNIICPMPKYDVFISYRRKDSADRANLIRSYLSENFQSDKIFLDTDEIHEGPFPEYIDSALRSAKYFILLISNSSFPNQQKSDEIDYYHEEIRRALSYNLTIIPIIYDNININSLDIPEDINPIKIQNYIISHSDDPSSLRRRLIDFTKKKNYHLKDWIAFPLAIISIYIIISILSGIGMYIYDNYFISYNHAAEEASEHVFENNGVFYYPISDNKLVCFTPDSNKVSTIINERPNSNSVIITGQDAYKIGFWTTATGLMYQMVNSKYKPHNGKQVLAYIGATVAVVAGIGLGCTIEQMIFPTYQNRLVSEYIERPEFWKEIIRIKYSRNNNTLYY